MTRAINFGNVTTIKRKMKKTNTMCEFKAMYFTYIIAPKALLITVLCTVRFLHKYFQCEPPERKLFGVATYIHTTT